MRMSNFLRLAPLRPHEMATSHREVGIAHVTVVPGNAGPSERSEDAEGDERTVATADADEGALDDSS